MLIGREAESGLVVAESWGRGRICLKHLGIWSEMPDYTWCLVACALSHQTVLSLSCYSTFLSFDQK